jgi:hypothetical protein
VCPAEKICKGLKQVLDNEYGCWNSSRFSHCLVRNVHGGVHMGMGVIEHGKKNGIASAI